MKMARCEFCRKKMSASGIPAHVSFKHRGMVLAKFRTNPYMLAYALAEHGVMPAMQLSLPAPNPLTVYSRRPLGMMAAPILELRRPKGYCPGYGYARPSDALAGQLRFHRPVY